MIGESAFFVATAENQKTGLVKTKLDKLFYGDGGIETFESATGRMISWEVIDSEVEMDSFAFALDNHDLVLFDSPLLAKGNVIKFKYGYPGDMSNEFVGIINSRTGWRTLNVSGNFKSEIVIANNQATEKFLNKKLSDIATQLFKREGLKAKVDDTKIVYSVVVRRDETVLQFLKRKAREAGGAYEVYVEGDTGFFVKKKLDQAPGFMLKYGTEVKDEDYTATAEPEFEDTQQNVAVEETVKGFDLVNGKSIRESGSNKNSGQTSLGARTGLWDEAAGTRKLSPAKAGASAETGQAKPTAKQKPDEAKAEAMSAFDSKAARAYKLKWPMIGTPRLKAKMVMMVECASKLISGRWYVEQARHFSVGGDYTTELLMIRNATGLAVGTQAATPAGGQNTKKPDTENKVKYSEDAGTRVPVRGGGG